MLSIAISGEEIVNLLRLANSKTILPTSIQREEEVFMTAAFLYGSMAYDPSLMLDCLRPLTLRSRISTAQFKPIPHNDRIDLEAFRYKTVDEWNMDDVIGWMISVAKRHKIPVEDVNMHRFANCTGSLLTLMDQKNFVDRDNTYGSLLFNEFCRFQLENMSTPGTSSASAWLRDCNSSNNNSRLTTANNCNVQFCGAEKRQRLQHVAAAAASSSSSFSVEDLISNDNYARRHSVIKCAPGKSLNSGKTIPPNDTLNTKHWGGKGKGKRMKEECEEQPEKIIRKRAQRTTGNKLWEFIRDLLLESESSPSVVRWENKSDGVFRIVDSEQLARLWGAKKSNRNMTYEKLSRAMRTYYEKKILVPVPKTGLYPKKLVYKFGPNASGFQRAPNSTTSALSCSRSGKGKIMPGKGKSIGKNQANYEMISDDDE